MNNPLVGSPKRETPKSNRHTGIPHTLLFLILKQLEASRPSESIQQGILQ